ncbi:MAG: hypothetical protein QOJ72_1812 [Nocardioidaceae bacterium]|nr:hypothetical protein [Nocardioidaceae bacterium]
MATPVSRSRTRTHRVRPDLLVGAGLIALVTLGRLLWQASDSGWFDTFGTR